MFLDGCNEALGCTILLSGPEPEHKALKQLKQTLQKIFLLAKNIVYERHYLDMLGVKVPPPPLQPVSSELTYENLVLR